MEQDNKTPSYMGRLKEVLNPIFSADHGTPSHIANQTLVAIGGIINDAHSDGAHMMNDRVRRADRRRKFAKAAMNGLMANNQISSLSPEKLTHCCYVQADAMLAYEEKEETEKENADGQVNE